VAGHADGAPALDVTASDVDDASSAALVAQLALRPSAASTLLTLSLDDNRLSRLPDLAGVLVALRRFSANGNRIAVLEPVRLPETLEFLALDRNALRRFEDTATGDGTAASLGRLAVCTVRGNPGVDLDFVDAVLAAAPALPELDARDCGVAAVRGSGVLATALQAAVRTVRLAGNDAVGSLPPGLFEGGDDDRLDVTALRNWLDRHRGAPLLAAGGRIAKLSRRAGDDRADATTGTLDLSSLGLDGPAARAALREASVTVGDRLTRVVLDGNPLGRLNDDSFAPLAASSPALSAVSLAGCALTALPSSVGALPDLRRLDASNNRACC